MYQYFMNNPLGRKTVGDCSVRAISKALGVSWDEAHDMLSDMSKNMGTIMNDNDVISAVLRMHGFYRENLPNFCPDCYTVRDFAEDSPVGTYVLCSGNHVVTVINGTYFDSFDSGDEVPLWFWTR